MLTEPTLLETKAIIAQSPCPDRLTIEAIHKEHLRFLLARAKGIGLDTYASPKISDAQTIQITKKNRGRNTISSYSKRV